jgi:hypothetical protein
MMKLKAPAPPVDVTEWRKLSQIAQLRPLAIRWVEYGTDTPGFIHIFYVVKMAAYIWGGLAIIAATPGFAGIGDIGTWWHEPVVYQKIIAYTCLIELLGLGQSTGPMCFKFLPPFTAVFHWGRTGTLRQPPWPKHVPGTDGDTRTIVDAVLYWVVIALLVRMLVGGGAGTAVDPKAGLAPEWTILGFLVALILLGLRDKVVWVGARPDVYVWALALFLFPYAQMMAGLKVALAVIWLCAAVSKFTRHFTTVVSVMTSNAPARPKWFKRAMYRKFPDDLRPSNFAHVVAHSGTVIELGAPLILLFAQPQHTWLIAVAVGSLLLLHIVITSHVPVAVPNEWNLYMMAAAVWLFWTHRTDSLSGLLDPGLIAFLLVVWAFPVIYGSIRPDRICFILSMRYYAGNWPASAWCFRGDAVNKVSANVPKASGLMHEQLEALYDAEFAEIANQKFRTWRSMHIQGRAINGLIGRGLDNPDEYFCVEGEVMGSGLNGWNMGDGHMHNAQLLESVQKRCNFAPGELVVVMIESQPVGRKDIAYRIVDAATGTIESGRVKTDDIIDRQPWDESPLPVVILGSALVGGVGAMR